MAGIYYGSMYGGSTTSILVNIPGEAASVVTCLDGHEMAKRGRAGPALGMAAMGSFLAGTVSIIFLMLVAPALARVAVAFGPPEYFALMVLGLTVLAFMTQGSIVKSLLMACVGIVLGLIGIDQITAQARLTFDRPELLDGIGLVPVVMGLFGIAEILTNLEKTLKREIISARIGSLWPTRVDWMRSKWALVRGTFLGFFLGILPGGGAVISSFASYAIEKKLSKHPEEFGKGAIEGVAGPEAANNAAATGVLVPLLTLGIPTSATAAILLGAFQNYGIQPGPLLFQSQADLVWGLIASLYVGNVILLILNLPLIGIWVKVLEIPKDILYAGILVFATLGAYSLHQSWVDLLMLYVFGLLGFAMRRWDIPVGPAVIGLILGPLAETQFRRALSISQGDATVFLTQPISAGFLAITAALIVVPWVVRKVRARRASPR
jgi:putative tricarboxylic transport membrane protein